MGKNKTTKFSILPSFPNVFQNFSWTKPEANGCDGIVDLKGNWSQIFGNNNPVILELACGHADYARALAQQNPNKNYVAIDIKGNRIYTGAKRSLDENLTNIRFLRTEISVLHHFFNTNEVSDIWITFPDPFLKKSKATRRLTHPNYLEIYRKVLQKTGSIRLKTDSPLLYEYTLVVIEQERLKMQKNIQDVYALNPIPESLKIQTYYEKMHLLDGRTIRFIQFEL